MLKKFTSIFKNKDTQSYQTPAGFEVYNKQRPKRTLKTFCQAPSINMYFSWEGKVIACCFNQSFVLGHYPEQTIEEIWKGEKIKELRESLKNYDLSNGCFTCKFNLQNSEETYSNALRFDEYEVAEFPKMMEFQLGNTCNLACTMCNGFLSSTIRKNRDGLPAIPMRYDGEFVEQLKAFIPHLDFTNFSGGEPFLIDIYYDIWDAIIALNPECVIKITTNGTVLNNRVKRLLEKGNFDITISVDSLIPEKYEAIRVGAKYERVMEHVRYFSQYCKERDTYLNINFCPMQDNWKEIPSLLGFCQSMEATIYFSIVYEPYSKSMQWLSIDELENLIIKIEQELEDKQLMKSSRNYGEWLRLKDQINNWIQSKLKEDRVIQPIEYMALFNQRIEKIDILLFPKDEYSEILMIAERISDKLKKDEYNLNLAYERLQNISDKELVEYLKSPDYRKKDFYIDNYKL